MASILLEDSPIAARRLRVSRRLKPASTSRRVVSVATKVQLPPLPLPRTETRRLTYPHTLARKSARKLFAAQLQTFQISDHGHGNALRLEELVGYGCNFFCRDLFNS